MDMPALVSSRGARPWVRPAGAAIRWAPFVLLAFSAAAREARLGVGLVLLAGLVTVALAGHVVPLSDRRLTVAWAAVLPAGLVLAWSTIPGPPALPGLGSCADPLSPPAVWRAFEALAVLGTTAILVPIGGREPLLLRRPRDARVAAVACLAPFVTVAAILLGPVAAIPFFGDVNMVFPPASFVPAALLAVSNAALEEVAYRGALMGWGARVIGPRSSLLVQSLVFGFAHWGPDVQAGAWLIFAGLTAAGLLLGLAARRSGSLFLPFALHAAVDVPLYHALACRLI
jgi:membrane protease YdiL (CAAX protease family)